MRGDKMKARAEAKAREVGPVLDELQAQGLTRQGIVDALNVRGVLSVTGGAITISVMDSILSRWRGLKKRGEAPCYADRPARASR